MIDGGAGAAKLGIAAVSPAIKLGWKSLKPHLARRKVASGERYDFDIVSAHLDAALNILGNRAETPLQTVSIGMQRVLSKSPEAFSLPYIQEWINDPRVRALLKQSVIAAFNGTDSESLEKQAGLLFEEITTEPRQKAGPIVDEALQFLARTIDAELSISDALLLNSIAQVTDELKGGLEGVHTRLAELMDTSAPLPRDVVDPYVHEILNRINKRRFFGVDPTKELLSWAARCDSGDMQHCSETLKIRVFRDLAAALARGKDIAEAEKWLSKVSRISPSTNIQIDRCRLLICSGEIQNALLTLQPMDSPEASALIIDALYQRDGLEASFGFFSGRIKTAARLTPAGLFVLANQSIQAEAWNRAYDLLRTATSEQVDLCPAILSVRAQLGLALCRSEGDIAETFTVTPLHPRTVQFSEDPEKIEKRKHALADFVALLPYTEQLALEDHKHFVEEHIMWLRVTHPDLAEREQAYAELRELLADFDKAPRFIKFGIDWEIPFDREAIIQHLENRKVLVGWHPHEAIAAFLLILNSGEPEKILAHLRANRQQLESILKGAPLFSVEVEALTIIGRSDEVKRLMSENKSNIAPEHFAALENRVAELIGGDPVTLRRSSFAATGSDIDRRHLVEALLGQRLFLEAATHLLALFDKSPTATTARTICQCYLNAGNSGKFTRFVERADFQRLIPSDQELQEFAAWAALYKGDILKARELIEPIKNGDGGPNARGLWLTATIEMGDWTALYSHVASDLTHHNDRSDEELVNALHLGAFVQFAEIEKLLDVVAARGLEGKNAALLVAAYTKAVELGLDQTKRSIHTWFSEALKLSGPKGPIQQFNMRQVVGELKSRKEQNDFVTNLVVKGDAALAIAVGPLNLTVTGAVAGNLLRNAANVSWRQKSGLPLFSGNRLGQTLPPLSDVTLDRTALLVLATVNLLEKAISRFERVTIPQGTLSEFLHDLTRERFHQPSRVSSAKSMINHLATSRLQTMKRTAILDATLVSEVGDELASLLEEAESVGGLVIVSPPVHKIGSYMEEIADLARFSERICGLHELIDFLVNEGILSEDEEARVRESFGEARERWPECGAPSFEMPLYLDNLAADRLQTAGLIGLLARRFSGVFVHRDVQSHANALVEHDEVQGRVEKIVEDIRRILADGIKSGKVGFGPSEARRSTKRGEIALASVTNLLRDPGQATICLCDDRAINQHGAITDKGRRTIPIFTSLELLNHLVIEGVLTAQEETRALQTLRTSGAMFVPLNRQELAHAALRGNPMKAASAELTAISSYIDFVRMRELIRMPEEETWLLRVCLEIMAAIREVWDRAATAELAAAASTRLLGVLPDISEWGELSIAQGGAMGQRRHLALRLSYFSNAWALQDETRLPAYFEWVERHVLGPIRRQDPAAWTDSVEYERTIAAGTFKKLRDEIGSEIEGLR